MTEFEPQVAEALRGFLRDMIADARPLAEATNDELADEFLRKGLARRVAEAIEAAADAGEHRQAGFADKVYEKSLAALRGET